MLNIIWPILKEQDQCLIEDSKVYKDNSLIRMMGVQVHQLIKIIQQLIIRKTL